MQEEKDLPAEKTPHQNSSFLSPQISMISQKKNAVAQRISSARLHKIKELKNEIFYLQHQLEASSLENHILKQLQCRHSKAIGRYKSSESNLPGLLASHYNEVRALRKLLRMSQEGERNTSRKLRKVEAELLKAKDALQTLLMLSEDKALAEREDLGHKLSVLTGKLEVNDKRIQSLEKQLKLNNSTFRRQLASENKKAVEAGIITKNLQMEINSLHQKIKEKDRQLHVKNIYANRMFKILKDKSDSVPHEKKYLREGRLLMEEYACLEYMKEKEKDLLKQELRKLMKTEQTPLSDSVKENNQETDAVEEYKKEEKRPDEQLNNSEKARSKCVTPGPRNKTPLRLKKKYIFSEATENLHYGLPTSGTKSKKGSLCNHRHAGQDCSETAESKVENSSGLYEPSFGKVTETRQKDSSTEAKGCAHVTFAERKISLMKELFGPGCV
ncbi:lebercilin-like protein [Limosa lapponica baueri]|uniref:Lebercilin-like protein n=1 Tax=Limosa lapponica baueri TaxID=1758121 RepID=A0A2I0TFP1_LIMLA|nr:lebercilin-like protein [Limosa lapponica baueri]